MSLGSRIILAVLGILFIIGGLFCVALYLNIAFVQGTIFDDFAGEESAGVTGLFLLLAGVVLTSLVFRKGDESRGTPRTVVQYNQNGEVNISFQAIENMALRVSRQVHGIRETETRVSYTGQGLTIIIRVKALPDMPLPALSVELQDKVKEYVEHITGTVVNEVRVSIENIVVDNIR